MTAVHDMLILATTSALAAFTVAPWAGALTVFYLLIAARIVLRPSIAAPALGSSMCVGLIFAAWCTKRSKATASLDHHVVTAS